MTEAGFAAPAGPLMIFSTCSGGYTLRYLHTLAPEARILAGAAQRNHRKTPGRGLPRPAGRDQHWPKENLGPASLPDAKSVSAKLCHTRGRHRLMSDVLWDKDHMSDERYLRVIPPANIHCASGTQICSYPMARCASPARLAQLALRPRSTGAALITRSAQRKNSPPSRRFSFPKLSNIGQRFIPN